MPGRQTWPARNALDIFARHRMFPAGASSVEAGESTVGRRTTAPAGGSARSKPSGKLSDGRLKAAPPEFSRQRRARHALGGDRPAGRSRATGSWSAPRPARDGGVGRTGTGRAHAPAHARRRRPATEPADPRERTVSCALHADPGIRCEPLELAHTLRPCSFTSRSRPSRVDLASDECLPPPFAKAQAPTSRQGFSPGIGTGPSVPGTWRPSEQAG